MAKYIQEQRDISYFRSYPNSSAVPSILRLNTIKYFALELISIVENAPSSRSPVNHSRLFTCFHWRNGMAELYEIVARVLISSRMSKISYYSQLSEGNARRSTSPRKIQLSRPCEVQPYVAANTLMMITGLLS